MRIELDHFTKRFGSFTAVPDMNLVVKEGEMLALLGPSGCGKTTTLFAISGILKADGGRIRIGGRDVTNLPAQQRNVGVVFQSYALYPHMTARENIAFPLKLRSTDRATIDDSVEKLARLLEIEALLDRRPAQMSGGQQQRVALARALVRRPGCPAPRRTARQPRRAASSRHAGRNPSHPARDAHDRDPRHSRSGRGNEHVRPHRDPRQG